eukprot:c19681_g1_i1 orf=791-1126(+)
MYGVSVAIIHKLNDFYGINQAIFTGELSILKMLNWCIALEIFFLLFFWLSRVLSEVLADMANSPVTCECLFRDGHILEIQHMVECLFVHCNCCGSACDMDAINIPHEHVLG